MTLTAEPPVQKTPAPTNGGAPSGTGSGTGLRTSARQIGDLSLRPKPLTVPVMFHHTVEHNQHKAALLYKEEKEWHPITYLELDQRVKELAQGFLDLGVAHGERIALLSENRPEWAVVDLAALSIGAVNVPLYSTLPTGQAEYIVSDSEARVLVVSNKKQLEKAIAFRDNLPRLEHVVVMDPTDPLPERVLTLAELTERGKARPNAAAELAERSRAVQPDDLASIIYTSGTTGAPKGAMLTHDNFMSNAQSAAPIFKISPTDLFLSFLPLSHVFERLAGHYFPLLVGATIAYAESVFTVQGNMVEVKPTVMASVPRLYEAIHSRMLDGINKQPEKQKKMALWAIGIGERFYADRISGKQPDLLSRLLYPIADALVLKKIREKVTGGDLRFFISGGAPLPVETAKFMTSVGLNLIEGYGLTETSPVICANLPEKIRVGTVGPPIPGVQVRIADDGEILSKGPHIMRGYFNNPEATAQSINADGWFHTGDIGIIDQNGFLKITDRKKDILVLANGKNVAPQPIESKLKASQYIGSVVLFGDRQPQVVALIVPDFEHLKKWAREQSFETKDMEALLKRPEVVKFYKSEVERLSTDLADFERIKRFALIPRDFSQEHGEVTPTLKIKRKVVAENFAKEIGALYGGSKSEG